MLSLSDLGTVLVGCRLVQSDLWNRAAKSGDLDQVLDALAADPPWWWDGKPPAPHGLTGYQEAVIRDRFEAGDPVGLRAGLSLNQFLLLGHLGEGGQGRVYLSRQLRPSRFAAVKILTRDTEARRKRFEQEAKAMMQLSHAAIARFYQYERIRDDAGQLTNDYLIAMEYVEGTDLYRLVRRNGPTPWRFAVRWTIQLLSGLEYLHTRGFIHRDVKPENVMATGPVKGWPDPTKTGVKLLDLGAVKPAAGEDEALLAGGKIFVGTPEYAPPEQWKGTLVPSSDLYAAGGTLFFLLTDRTPFQKEKRDPHAYMASHLSDLPPDIRELNPNVPWRVNSVFRQMLAKQPDDRGSARELIDELSKALSEGDHSGKPRTPKPGVKPPKVLPSSVLSGQVGAGGSSELAQRVPGPFDVVLSLLERVFIPEHRRPRVEDRLTAQERVLALIRRPLVIAILVCLVALVVWLVW